MRKKLFFLLMMLFGSFDVLAYDPGYLMESVEVYKEKIHPRIVNRLPSNERKIIRRLNIKLHMDGYSVIHAVAIKDIEQVSVSLGFLMAIYNMAECLYIEERFKKSNFCNKYFDYFFIHSLNRIEGVQMSVSDFAFRKNKKLLARWNNDSQIQKNISLMYFSALMFVMAHEYGHFVEGFNLPSDSLDQRKRLERKVDLWALNRMNAIGENPIIGATVTLAYLSQVERYRRELKEENQDNDSFVQIPSAHYRPSMRAIWAFEVICKKGSKKIRKACDFLEEVADDFE